MAFIDSMDYAPKEYEKYRMKKLNALNKKICRIRRVYEDVYLFIHSFQFQFINYIFNTSDDPIELLAYSDVDRR